VRRRSRRPARRTAIGYRHCCPRRRRLHDAGRNEHFVGLQLAASCQRLGHAFDGIPIVHDGFERRGPDLALPLARPVPRRQYGNRDWRAGDGFVTQTRKSDGLDVMHLPRKGVANNDISPIAVPPARHQHEILPWSQIPFAVTMSRKAGSAENRQMVQLNGKRCVAHTWADNSGIWYQLALASRRGTFRPEATGWASETI